MRERKKDIGKRGIGRKRNKKCLETKSQYADLERERKKERKIEKSRN